MAGSRAASAREPGQIREEAALSDTARAPRISLAGADDRRARPRTGFEEGCTVRFPTHGRRGGRIALDEWFNDRHLAVAAARHARPRHPEIDRAACAVAGDGDRAPREPGPREPQRGQGRRSSGLERLDGEPHVCALVLRAAGGGSRLGQAACLARPARDQLPARSPRPALPGDTARLRRIAELSESHQGPRPGGLLDRLGRHRCHRPHLGRDHAPLPRDAPPRGASDGPADRARGRCRARRGCGLGGGRRSERSQARRGALGRRPQSPVARPGGARHRIRALGKHVRGGGLADHLGQVRDAARGAVRAAGGSGAAPAHRRDARTRSTSGCCARHPRSCATGCRRGPAASPGWSGSSTTRSCAPPCGTSAATTRRS